MRQPRADRWHRKPVAEFGGLAIVLAFAVVAAFAPVHGRLLGIAGFTVLIAALGFCDDLRSWKPKTKLLVQALVAIATVSQGTVYPLSNTHWLNVCFTLAWIVGITNAFNLLDNMDGLSAGIAILAGVMLSLLTPDVPLRTLTLIFAGACGGFLLFNFKPAKIFMGDTGSLAIGYYLACASVLASGHTSAVSPGLFAPLLVLFLPVFDTMLVGVTRRVNGRAITAGARDHTSHRLVMLGISERGAVLLLYALAALSGFVAILSKRIWPELGLGVVGLFLLLATLFWLRLASVPLPDEFLSRTRVYVPTATEFVQSAAATAGAVLLDTGVLLLSLYLAFLSCVGHFGRLQLSQYLALCCIALAGKLTPLALFGAYRRRSTAALRLAYAVTKSAVAGSIVLVAAGLFWNRFNGLSRALFVTDLLLTLILLMGVRVSDSLFDYVLRPAVHRRSILVDTQGSRLSSYLEQVDGRYELADVIHVDTPAWPQRLVAAIDRSSPQAIYCGPDCDLGVRQRVAEVAGMYRLPCFEIELAVRELFPARPARLKVAALKIGSEEGFAPVVGQWRCDASSRERHV